MQHSLVSVFTPSLMSAEDLEHIFVQREPLAKDLIRRIVDSTKGRGKEHSLLIGMRGMGKTHLVSLVYYRVKAMPELQDKLLIAWLREEEWGVDSWLDLVMRIFRAVAEDRGSADSGMAQDLLDRFYKDGFESAKGSATKFLRDLIGKRTLLLIIENMDDLFHGLGEQGQQEFRAFLQEYRCCTVLATTPAMFRGVESREMPFYGFFHPCYLESIEVDEAVKMLGQIASLNTVRDVQLTNLRKPQITQSTYDHHDLAVFLQSAQGRARVRAVHHLAGGNPRVYTLFAQFMTRESLDDLVDAFMKMLDDLTPYYQSRMKDLSNQQRKIVELLVDRRQAVMVKDIGDACFIDQRAVASQLRELKKKGYVVSNEVGRESFYELREVLMRFCMEVKKFRGRWVELIVDFLKIWYRPDQRLGMMERFSDSKLMSHDDLKRAFLSEDDPVSAVCIFEFDLALKKQNKLLSFKLSEELYSCEVMKDTEYQEIKSLIEDEKYKEALVYFYSQLTTSKPSDYEAWFSLGNSLGNLGRYDKSFLAFEQSILINPTQYKAWNNRGIVLEILDRYEESINSFDQAICIRPKSHQALNNKGWAYFKWNKYVESIKCYEQSIVVQADQYNSWHNKGLVQLVIGEYSSAVNTLQQAFKYISDSKVHRYYDVSELIQEFIEELIPRFTQPPIQQTLLIPLLNIYQQANVITELGAALVNTLHLIVAPTISDHTAAQWLALWRTSSLGNEPAMELPLRLMSTAIEYKKDPSKRQRLWLNLPSEERPILDQALKLLD